MSKDVKKEYTNGEITVVWQSAKCQHAAECVRGLGSVFNTRKRPWINVEGANGEDVINTVAKCPSGALTMKTDI
jgi:uncharacterized Fe-S cluster protein YjdI